MRGFLRGPAGASSSSRPRPFQTITHYWYQENRSDPALVLGAERDDIFQEGYVLKLMPGVGTCELVDKASQESASPLEDSMDILLRSGHITQFFSVSFL